MRIWTKVPNLKLHQPSGCSYLITLHLMGRCRLYSSSRATICSNNKCQFPRRRGEKSERRYRRKLADLARCFGWIRSGHGIYISFLHIFSFGIFFSFSFCFLFKFIFLSNFFSLSLGCLIWFHDKFLVCTMYLTLIREY